MRQVHTSPNVALINHLRSILESMGIACTVRGEFLSGAVGELPPVECWAELWIVDDDRYDDAMDVVRREGHGSRPMDRRWTCPGCGETIEPTFSECWNCGGFPEALDGTG